MNRQPASQQRASQPARRADGQAERDIDRHLMNRITRLHFRRKRHSKTNCIATVIKLRFLAVVIQFLALLIIVNYHFISISVRIVSP